MSLSVSRVETVLSLQQLLSSEGKATCPECPVAKLDSGSALPLVAFSSGHGSSAKRMRSFGDMQQALVPDVDDQGWGFRQPLIQWLSDVNFEMALSQRPISHVPYRHSCWERLELKAAERAPFDSLLPLARRRLRRCSLSCFITATSDWQYSLPPCQRVQVSSCMHRSWLSGASDEEGSASEGRVPSPPASDTESGSLLDTVLMAEWEDRAEQGLFRYDVTACPTKVVPGAYGFVAQCNEGRGSKKRPTEFCVDKVKHAASPVPAL